MTDGGSNWQPPDPGAAPPPSPSGAGGLAPPTPTAAEAPTASLEAPGAGPRRSRGKVIAAAVGALVIVGAGVFAITRISGDAAAGGAESPEAAAEQLLDALDAEDPLGAIDVLLPGERETFREPLQQLVTQLEDWEVLSDDDLANISGVDITVTDRDVEADDTNVEDIVNVTVTASVAGTVDGEELPIGDWIRDNVDEDDLAELDAETDPEEGSFPVTAVRQDGRWYLSLFYTAAELARAETDFDIPAEPIALNGGDDPEAAMDAFLGAVAELDLTAMIGALNPDEFEALQRYAPLFLDDAQAELDTSIRDADLSIEVTDTTYTVSGDGSTRSIFVGSMSFEMTAEGETLSAEWADGCLLATVPGRDETFDSCDSAAQLQDELDLDDVLEDPQAVQDAITDVQAAFADYENPGFIVKEVDGSWYLSPMATATEQVLAVMDAISREEIEDLSEQIGELVGTIEEQVEDGRIDVPELEDFEPPTDDDIVADDTVVTDGTVVTDDTTTPESTFVDEQCFELDAAEAEACYRELVDSGRLEEDLMPWFFRFPECEAAELLWDGEYYSLPDDEFVAAVGALQPCVQGLISAGQVDQFDVGELASPECLQGVNPYLLDVNSAEFDEFTACVYDE